jgi:hypothetical protein
MLSITSVVLIIMVSNVRLGETVQQFETISVINGYFSGVMFILNNYRLVIVKSCQESMF